MGKTEQFAVVDRFEDGGFAVLLVGADESEHIVPRASLPPAATEGAWLRVRFQNDQLLWAIVDEAKTGEVHRRIASKMDLLRSRGRRPRMRGNDVNDVSAKGQED